MIHGQDTMMNSFGLLPGLLKLLESKLTLIRLRPFGVSLVVPMLIPLRFHGMTSGQCPFSLCMTSLERFVCNGKVSQT